MKKYLLMVVAVMAMAGFANAQHTKGYVPPPGPDGYPTCYSDADCTPGTFCVQNLPLSPYCSDPQTDPQNCGFEGNNCGTCGDCEGGKCVPGTCPSASIDRLKSKHNEVTASLMQFRKS